MLKYAANGMNMAGAGGFDVNQLKTEFAKLGSSFNVWSTENFTYIVVRGIDQNLEPTLKLLGLFISDPRLEQSKIKTIINGEKANRRVERSEPDAVAEALFEFGLYGAQSEYINRLTMSELKKLRAEQLVATFKEATGYQATVRYCGKHELATIDSFVKNYIPLPQSPKVDKAPLDKPKTQYAANTILFVNKPKARQSKMYVFVNGSPFNINDAPYIDAFNDYFGGGFSGLLLQEIREYRSLAYSAGGSFRYPQTKGSPVDFVGYVGTQSDKTLIAMETLDSLINFMPSKPERIYMIRNHLELSAQTGRPSFRGIAARVEYWKRQGFDTDPLMVKLPVYRSLTWDDLDNFYNQRLKNKPTVYMIVGDEKNIDMNQLAKYGKIVKIKEQALFSK